jgi:hypothetical protein
MPEPGWASGAIGRPSIVCPSNSQRILSPSPSQYTRFDVTRMVIALFLRPCRRACLGSSAYCPVSAIRTNQLNSWRFRLHLQSRTADETVQLPLSLYVRLFGPSLFP